MNRHALRGGALLLALLLLLPAASVRAECAPSDLAAARQAYDTAYAFVQQGKWNTAVRHLKEAVAACPEHWNSVELLAQAYLRTKQEDLAVEQYRNLVDGKYGGDLDAAEVRVLSGYGFALLKAKDAATAEKVYLTLVDKEPENEENFKRLVYVYEVTKQYEKAIDYEKQLYEMEPEDHEYAKKIGDLYKKAGDTVEAQKWYDQAAAAGVATAGAFSLGRDQMKAGNYADAAAAFRSYLEGNPESAAAWQNLGYCYTKMSQRKDAIAAYEKALALKPGNHSIAASLGFLYLDENNVSSAEKLAREAVDQWDAGAKKKADMYYLMGQVLEKKGQYRDAIDMFDQIVEDPFWGDQARDQIQRQRQLIAREEALKKQAEQGR